MGNRVDSLRISRAVSQVANQVVSRVNNQVDNLQINPAVSLQGFLVGNPVEAQVADLPTVRLCIRRLSPVYSLLANRRVNRANILRRNLLVGQLRFQLVNHQDSRLANRRDSHLIFQQVNRLHLPARFLLVNRPDNPACTPRFNQPDSRHRSRVVSHLHSHLANLRPAQDRHRQDNLQANHRVNQLVDHRLNHLDNHRVSPQVNHLGNQRNIHQGSRAVNHPANQP